MTTTDTIAAAHGAPATRRRWTDPRWLRASLGSGLLGGICCLGAAVATAAGLGIAGSVTAFMESYQVYFILASIAVMGFWLVRHLRRRGISPLNVRAAVRAVGRHLAVMGVVYVVTLGIAMGISQLVTM